MKFKPTLIKKEIFFFTLCHEMSIADRSSSNGGSESRTSLTLTIRKDDDLNSSLEVNWELIRYFTSELFTSFFKIGGGTLNNFQNSPMFIVRDAEIVLNTQSLLNRAGTST